MTRSVPVRLPTMAPRPWAGPCVRRISFDEGPTVTVVDLDYQHLVSVVVDLGICPGTERRGAEGTAAVLAQALLSGAGRDYGDRLDDLGADVSTDPVGPRLICQIPASRIAAGLDLLTQAVRHTHLDNGDIDDIKQEQFRALNEAQAGDPETRAWTELPRLLFAPGTRAHLPAGGTPESLQQVTPADVTRLYRTQINAADARVTIAGDLTGIDVEEAVTSTLGTWRSTRPARAARNPAPRRPEPHCRFIHQPHGEARLLLAIPGPSRNEADWHAYVAAAHILGAPHTGRYDRRLHDLGFMCSMSARPTPLHHDRGAFVVTIGVAEHDAVAVLREIETITRTAREHGISPAECAAARDMLGYLLPRPYETAATAGPHVADLTAHGLPADYDTHTVKATRELTRRQIDTAIRDHIDPEQMSVIAIGSEELHQTLHVSGTLPIVEETTVLRAQLDG